jgi:TonB family protein
MSVPVEVRFIRRSIASAPTAEEIANRMVRPRPVKLAQPVYPAAMKLAKIEGTVAVQFVIDTTGRVRDVSVVSTTHPAFADQAIACISNWRFAPGTKDGRAVNVRAVQKLEFSMAGQVNAVDVAKFRKKAGAQ